MSDPNQPGGSSTPPGWYPDGQGGQRWWDGTRWTEHTQPPSGPTPTEPQTPSAPGGDLPTQIAPNRASDYPGGSQYGAPQGGAPQYGAPGGGQYGAPGSGQYGAPGQQFGGYGGPTGGSGGNKKLFVIIGAAVGAVILAVILLFVLLKVVGGGSPEDVTKDYLTAVWEDDFSQRCELLSKSAQKDLLDSYEADDCDEYVDKAEKELEDTKESFEDANDADYDDVVGDVDLTVETKDVEEKGDDEAIVDYTQTLEYTGDDQDIIDNIFDGETEDEEDGKVKLVKEDGDWKVDDPYYSED